MQFASIGKQKAAYPKIDSNYFLNAFHPATKVVSLQLTFCNDTNALSIYELLQHECVNFDYCVQNVSLTSAFHPTVKTVGFPGLHFITISRCLCWGAAAFSFLLRYCAKGIS